MNENLSKRIQRIGAGFSVPKTGSNESKIPTPIENRSAAKSRSLQT
jgi:hypothetical protein